MEGRLGKGWVKTRRKRRKGEAERKGGRRGRGNIENRFADIEKAGGMSERGRLARDGGRRAAENFNAEAQGRRGRREVKENGGKSRKT